MASSTTKQRLKTEPSMASNADNNSNNRNNRRKKKIAMARKGLRSLTIAIGIPISIAILNIYIFPGSSWASTKPSWYYPPLWLLHLASLGCHCLMGLSAWLVWVEGGFHRQPAAVPLYAAQLGLSLAWTTLVLAHGAWRMGLVVALALIAVLFGCFMCFSRMNPIAGDLVKPCLAWVAFVAFLNYELLR